MNMLPKTRRTMRQLLEQNKNSYVPVWLGNMHTGQKKADKNGNIFVTFQDTGDVITVYNDVAPLILGMQVVIGHDRANPSMLKVVRARNQFPDKTSIETASVSDNLQWPHWDTLWVRNEQLITGLLLPIAGTLTLKLNSMPYEIDGVAYRCRDTIIDLSGEIPSTGANWVLIEIDETQTISLTAGSSVANRLVLKPTDIPAPTAGKRALWAVKVYFTQEEFIHNEKDTDLFDLRFTGYGMGGGSPDGSDGDIQFNDAGEFGGTGTFRRTSNGGIILGELGDFLAAAILAYDFFQGASGHSLVNIHATYGDDVATRITLMRAGGTDDAPTHVLADWILGRFGGRGYDDDDNDADSTGNSSAELRAVANEEFTPTAHGTRWEVWVTPDGEVDEILAATFENDGNFNLEGHKLTGVGDGSAADDVYNVDQVDSLLSGKQPYDSDLEDIAALAPADDSIVQRKSGEWVDRTVSQFITDILASGLSYLGLTNKPAAETNANDVFQVLSPGGVSAFVGTIATLPGGATLTYNVTSGQEGAMATSSTSQLAKIRLYNTTRGTSALILSCTTGSNTLVLTAAVPAGWQVGDTITIASQTVSGSFSWIDLEIVSGPTGKTALWLIGIINSATPGDRFTMHPLETFAGSKLKNIFAQANGVNNEVPRLIKITGNVFSCAWNGSPTSVTIREEGYFE